MSYPERKEPARGQVPDWTPQDCGEWESSRIYIEGDVVTDTHVPEEIRCSTLGERGLIPTPPGRFRCLIDHRGGILGPRFTEVDRPGRWERLETYEYGE